MDETLYTFLKRLSVQVESQDDAARLNDMADRAFEIDDNWGYHDQDVIEYLWSGEYEES